jgi:hypothetical protein
MPSSLLIFNTIATFNYLRIGVSETVCKSFGNIKYTIILLIFLNTLYLQ